jgi:hypothetical protein
MPLLLQEQYDHIVLKHYYLRTEGRLLSIYCDGESFKPAVLNLRSDDLSGSVTPTQGVHDCLRCESNHFLVAPVSQYTTYLI